MIFSCFPWKLNENVGGLFGGGGGGEAKVCWPTLSNYWGASSYAYVELLGYLASTLKGQDCGQFFISRVQYSRGFKQPISLGNYATEKIYDVLLVPYRCFSGGDFRFTLRPCVCLSDCPSVCPSVRKIWILQ